MRRRDRLILALATVLLMAPGLMSCGDDEITRPGSCDQTQAGYLPCNRSPEEVLNNFIVAYNRREIDAYAQLLHPDFRFYFQDNVAPRELGREYWTAEEDSTGTFGLFNSNLVSGITLSLTYDDAEEATLERSPNPVMLIRTISMKLTVDDVHGTTWLVEGDRQEFYFTRGEGADSETWYLYEWRDLPGVLYPVLGDALVSHSARPSSWGHLKLTYD